VAACQVVHVYDFFFFQAEDGIRDFHVTGVQTCALPIFTRSPDLRQARHTSIIEDIRVWTDERGARPEIQLREMLDSLGAKGKKRSEERRVGKECRCRWAP